MHNSYYLLAAIAHVSTSNTKYETQVDISDSNVCVLSAPHRCGHQAHRAHNLMIEWTKRRMPTPAMNNLISLCSCVIASFGSCVFWIFIYLFSDEEGSFVFMGFSGNWRRSHRHTNAEMCAQCTHTQAKMQCTENLQRTKHRRKDTKRNKREFNFVLRRCCSIHGSSGGVSQPTKYTQTREHSLTHTRQTE